MTQLTDKLNAFRAESSARGERHDCTVWATALAADMSYPDAHALLARNGRRPRKGIVFAGFMRQYDGKLLNGYRVTGVPVNHLTVAQVLRDFPKGRFILRKRGHVFAVVDGQILEPVPTGNRARITALWHLAKADAAPAPVPAPAPIGPAQGSLFS